MLKGIGTLFGKSPPIVTAKGRQRPVSVKPAPPTKDIRGVCVLPGIQCCSPAGDVGGKFYLFRDAPRLPLPSCTMPANCVCRFKKTADRRETDRRQVGLSETGRWYSGAERRKSGGRRLGKE